jgi:hypothetical protein
LRSSRTPCSGYQHLVIALDRCLKAVYLRTEILHMNQVAAARKVRFLA